MKMSKKCQYALKAIFELAWRNSDGPVKTHDISQKQRISMRFLEIILNELKHGGFVHSKRGNEGGYFLSRDARNLTVGEVIEYIQGPISVVPDSDSNTKNCVLLGHTAFKELWNNVNSAIFKVCRDTTFADLVALERASRDRSVVNYNI